MDQKGWDEGGSLQGEHGNHWVHSTWRPCTMAATPSLGPKQGIQGTFCSHTATLGAGKPPRCGPLWTPAHHSGSQAPCGVGGALLPPSSSSAHSLTLRSRAQPVPAGLTCLVFFLPKFLMYMSYSFTGGRSKKENVNEKSRSMSRSNLVLRVLENKFEADKLN